MNENEEHKKMGDEKFEKRTDAEVTLRQQGRDAYSGAGAARRDLWPGDSRVPPEAR